MWIEAASRGGPGTVGELVPGGYEALLRVLAPPRGPGPGDWWSDYRDLHKTIAAVGERHTSTPSAASFAVWDGHGFDRTSRRLAGANPPANWGEWRARIAQRKRMQFEDAQRDAHVRAALAEIPRFHRPHRTYYVMSGPVAAVAGFRYPGSDGWRNPDLFWPDDREWFVATDVDFWSLYVGGRLGFVDELAAAIPTGSERVGPDSPLPLED